MQYVTYSVSYTDFWDSWAESIESVTTESAYSFVINEYPGGIFCGIAKSEIAQEPSAIEYSFYIEGNKYAVAKNAAPITSLVAFEKGCKFEIQILGEEIQFVVNEVCIHSISKNWFFENGTTRLFSCAYSYGDTIYDSSVRKISGEASVLSEYSGKNICVSGTENLCFSICEAQAPVCAAATSDPAIVVSNSEAPTAYIATDIINRCSICSVAQRPASWATDAFKPSITRVNSVIPPLVSHASAAYPLTIRSQTYVPMSVLVVEDSKSSFFCEISSTVKLFVSVTSAHDGQSNGFISASLPAPISSTVVFDPGVQDVSEVDVCWCGQPVSTLAASDGQFHGTISASLPAPVSSAVTFDVGVTGSAGIAGVFCGYPASYLAAVDGQTHGLVSASLPTPASSIFASDSEALSVSEVDGFWRGRPAAYLAASDWQSHGVISAGLPVPTSRIFTSGSVQTSASTISGLLQWLPISQVEAIDGASDASVLAVSSIPDSKLAASSSVTTGVSFIRTAWLAGPVSVIIEECTSYVESNTRPPESAISVGSFYGNNAVIFSESYAPVSIPSIENDFFFCAELELPILLMEFVGEGSLFGKLPLSLSEESFASASKSGSMISDNGDPSVICDFFNEKSALLCGATIGGDDAAFSLSGEIIASGQSATIAHKPTVSISGELLSGAAVFSSSVLEIHGSITGREKIRNEVRATIEDELIIVTGTISENKKNSSKIVAAKLFETSGEISSRGVSASIIGRNLFCLDEFSAILQRKAERAIISCCGLQILSISGSLVATGVSSVILSGENRNVFIDFSGRIYARQSSSGTKFTYSEKIVKISGSIHAISGSNSYGTINNLAV